jgi:hypothetical protein
MPLLLMDVELLFLVCHHSTLGFYSLKNDCEAREKPLEKMKRKLKCKGFDVNVKFRPVDHTNCAYFFEPTGFTLF